MRSAFRLGAACVISLAIGCGGGGSFNGGGGGSGGGGGGAPTPSVTTTTVSTGSAKVAQNSPVTFTATVTGTGNPTGSVSFYLSGGYYGSAYLVAGSASVTASPAIPGIYSLIAQYAGDANNLGSTSAGVSQAVTGTTIMQVNAQTGTLFHSTNVTVTLQ